MNRTRMTKLTINTMGEDILDQFNTTDFEEVAAKMKEQERLASINKERTLAVAIAVTKLIDTDEWKIVAEKIEQLKLDFVRKPEDYYHNPGSAGIDYGARSALTLLTNWLRTQSLLVDSYAKSNPPKGETTGI